MTILAVPALHIGLLISMETLVRKDSNLVWVIAFAILVELAVALYLLQRQNRVQGSSGRRRVSVPGALGQPAV